jgi:hypothetical protein
MSFDQKFTDQEFKVVGSRPPRPDGVDKVTGRARYGADASAPGQLVARILRSPHAHAAIAVTLIFSKTVWPGIEPSMMATRSLRLRQWMK